MKIVWQLGMALVMCVMTLSAQAVTIVTELAVPPTSGQWSISTSQQGAATSSIESLSGQGGNLESNAPLPTGALSQTTSLDNNDRAEVVYFEDNGLGIVGDIFNSNLAFSYDYYRTNVAGGNTSAAPSLKLGFYNDACGPGEDCFFQMIFEPYLNALLVDGDWTTVNVSFDSGDFWVTGGFGLPNSSGGPPLRTLQETLAAANGNFAGASLVSIAIGMGTFNQGVNGFVDNVSFTINSRNETFDFEAASIPEPGQAILLATGLLLLAMRRKR